jgi:hypothetical protein
MSNQNIESLVENTKTGNLVWRVDTMNENELLGTEELRYIYKLILDGRSDSDILNMYVTLKDKGEDAVPFRADIDFIKNKRKEMEIVSEVLRDSLKEIVNISVPKQREGHLAQIIEVSAILLESNLNTIVEYPGGVSGGPVSKYAGAPVYTIKDRNDIPARLNRMELIEIFTKNVDKAVKMHGVSFFYDCYASHLQATIGKEMEEVGGFWPEVEKNPYKVIKAIVEIADRKGIKGMCPVCNMETQLPPFLKTIYSDILRN